MVLSDRERQLAVRTGGAHPVSDVESEHLGASVSVHQRDEVRFRSAEGTSESVLLLAHVQLLLA